MEGWIKLHRQLKEHWLWKSENRLKWWIDILLTVNHDDSKVLIKGTLIDCKRGQSIRSLESWAKDWNVSKGAVRDFFKLLQSDEMLTTESLQFTTRITVCKYEDYQSEVNAKKTLKKRKGNAEETLALPKQECKEGEECKEEELNNNWQSDFKIYKNDLRIAYKELLKDEKWISEREKLNPGIDVFLSIEKSCVEFWATEAGWENKKKSNSKSLNWKSTLTKAISQPMNKVYKNKSSIQQIIPQTTNTQICER